jgi:uncharacterized protein YidB (DUF937 family)
MNLTKPLMLGIGGLLVTKMLSGGSAAPQASPHHGKTPDGGLGGLLEKRRTAGHGEIVKSWLGPGQNQPIEPGQLGAALRWR